MQLVASPPIFLSQGSSFIFMIHYPFMNDLAHWYKASQFHYCQFSLAMNWSIEKSCGEKLLLAGVDKKKELFNVWYLYTIYTAVLLYAFAAIPPRKPISRVSELLQTEQTAKGRLTFVKTLLGFCGSAAIIIWLLFARSDCLCHPHQNPITLSGSIFS